MSLNAATAAPSGHFLVSRKKPSVIAQTHLISVSLSKEKGESSLTVKLIASDMDDTLLNSNTKLSERNAAAIHKAIAKGIVFMIATGRMYVSVKPYADAGVL